MGNKRSFFDRVRGVNHDVPSLPAPTVEQANVASIFDVEPPVGSRRGVHDVMDAFLAKAPKAPALTMDSAINVDTDGAKASAAGNQRNISEAMYMFFANQGFIGHQLAALIAQNWLIYKACAMPARDAIRKGWRVGSPDGKVVPAEVAAQITKADKAYKIKAQLKEFLTQGRIFGIRIAIPIIDYENPDEAYAAPFNLDGVRPNSFRGWTQVDPYWIMPELDEDASSNPMSQHFYEPTWWVVSGRRYHRSHLVIYRHGEITDILKPAYLYGGVPLPQLIVERVYGAERTANEAPLLTLTKRTVVYKVDLQQAATNWTRFNNVVEWAVKMWTNRGMRVIGKDEEHVQHDTALADLDSVIMTQYQLVAAVAEVPSVKLLGTSAKGFNATGEYDEASYHESLESIQENDLQPFLDRHYMLLGKSMGLELSVEAIWNPIDAPTAAELATTRQSQAATAQIHIAAGVIDAEEERKRLAMEDGGDYAGVIDLSVERAPREEEPFGY